MAKKLRILPKCPRLIGTGSPDRTIRPNNVFIPLLFKSRSSIMRGIHKLVRKGADK
jgi:hypothetical protein